MSLSSSLICSRHLLVVGLGIVLFYLLAFKYRHLAQYYHDAFDTISSCEQEIFTDSQLLKFDGREYESLYLVILGNVYDVTKGAKHYAKGQAYHMFIGRDATRSFVTGEFDHFSEELSDVSLLTDAELHQLLTWKEFYDKTYPFRGKAVGRYFDHHGEATEYYRHILARAAKASELKKNDRRYPSCNVEWKKETGTRVWCTSRSGDGQERRWIGLPRKVIESNEKDDDASQSSQFCACVPETSSDPHYLPFPGCDDTAVSCVIPDQN